jgi:hypothetical protein
MNIFTSEDTSQMVSSLFSLFSGYEAFSLIPQEYNSMDLTYTMIKSFDLLNKISELDLQALYTKIGNAYFHDDYFLYNGFISYISERYDYIGFRSNPLAYYSAGDRAYVNSLGYPLSHRATYQALDSLQRMYKLDDFAATYNLAGLVDHIINSQFLNSSYPDQSGGFLPVGEYNPLRADLLSKRIFLEYSFYAIQTLELLTTFLKIGDITFLDFNSSALYDYIFRYVIESSDMVYYQPYNVTEVDVILENTYYMAYILKTLDLYSLDSLKIENYLEHHIDYTNIKNVYYSYKLNELLDLSYEFNAELIQELISNLYSDSLHEFYKTTAHNVIDQQILFWICDMAKNDPLEIIVQYDEQVLLGTYLSLSASLSNLALSEFEYNLSFQFECTQLGEFVMIKENDNQFSLTVLIPQRATNYPTLEGRLVAYDTTWQLAEKTIIIHTRYNQKYYQDDMNGAVILSVLFLGVPGGFILISGKKIKRLT